MRCHKIGASSQAPTKNSATKPEVPQALGKAPLLGYKFYYLSGSQNTASQIESTPAAVLSMR